jgi:serine protease inhibitor
MKLSGCSVINHSTNFDSLKDSSIYSTSTIYTSNRTLEATDGVKALKTNVFFQDFSQPHVVVPSLNARIAIQTFGKIYDTLIPTGGWYGPSIYSFTKGVFINTFYFKNKFLYPFTDIGKQFFMTDRVQMLATTGNFRIRRAADFTTITLPMQVKFIWKPIAMALA